MNTITVDLHVHTLESDGSLSVKEVMQLAHANKVSILSLTDHETTNGITEAQELAQGFNITIIPGLELVTAYREETEIHVLGYFTYESIMNAALQERLKELRIQRTGLAYAMVKGLQRGGFALNWSTVENMAGPEGAVTKGHIMRALYEHEKGNIHWPTIASFFQPKGIAYYPYLDHAYEEAIELIEAFGGVPVLAHPGLIRNPKMVGELLDIRPVGLEVYYGYWEKRDLLINEFEKLAAEKAMLATGGSDFHGLKGPVSIGEIPVPSFCVEALRTLIKK